MARSFVFLLFLTSRVFAAPVAEVDLLGVETDLDVLQRVYGSTGTGRFGVPVAGGFDLDGDGHNDYAFAAMTADPMGRNDAGIVYLVFGDGTISGAIDTTGSQSRVLPILGAGAGENAGSEIWMARVTNSVSDTDLPLGDLIICRQDYSKPGAAAAGAMTIIPGQAMLKVLAETDDTVIDLAVIDGLSEEDNSLGVTTLVGANAGDRLCMWARNGDVSGDGVDDIAVGADQEDRVLESSTIDDAGAVYLVRGGQHLVGAGIVDIAGFGADAALPGNIMRVRLPANPFATYTIDGQEVASPIDKLAASPDNATNFHFGSTVNIAHLDDDANAELLVTTGLARAGGVLSPSGEGSGGSLDGTVYIIWGDNLSEPWDSNIDLELDSLTGSLSIIDGAGGNETFGEELLAPSIIDREPVKLTLYMKTLIKSQDATQAPATLSIQPAS